MTYPFTPISLIKLIIIFSVLLVWIFLRKSRKVLSFYLRVHMRQNQRQHTQKLEPRDNKAWNKGLSWLSCKRLVDLSSDLGYTSTGTATQWMDFSRLWPSISRNGSLPLPFCLMRSHWKLFTEKSSCHCINPLELTVPGPSSAVTHQ